MMGDYIYVYICMYVCYLLGRDDLFIFISELLVDPKRRKKLCEIGATKRSGVDMFVQVCMTYIKYTHTYVHTVHIHTTSCAGVHLRGLPHRSSRRRLPQRFRHAVLLERALPADRERRNLYDEERRLAVAEKGIHSVGV